MESSKLVGVKYPVKDMSGNVVGTKTIKSAQDVSNAAAIAITLSENADTVITIGYKEAFDLVQANPYGNLPSLD